MLLSQATGSVSSGILVPRVLSLPRESRVRREDPGNEVVPLAATSFPGSLFFASLGRPAIKGGREERPWKRGCRGSLSAFSVTGSKARESVVDATGDAWLLKVLPMETR